MRRLKFLLAHKTVLLFTLLVLTQPNAVAADPADWGESDWYKFIEMTVTVTLDKVHGGLEQVPRWMTQNPVNGRIPLLDAYSALSASGSAVKPGLQLWLQGKMREAALAGDDDRLDGYQAYFTALSTGDQGPLRRLLERRAREVRDRQNNPDKETVAPTPPSLALNNVLASADSAGSVEVVPQFTVGGNEDATLGLVRARAMVRGPKTSFIESVDVPLSRPSGYQAAQFYLQLPPGSPSGRYTVGLSLSDSRGLSTELKKATFDYRAPASPKDTPPEKEEPLKLDDPPPTPDPEKGADKRSAFRVEILGPTRGQVNKKLTFAAQLSGEPVEPVEYQWVLPDRTFRARSFVHQFDTPGTRELELIAVDGAGRKTTARATLSIEDRKLRVQLAAPSTTQVGKVVTLTSRVEGGHPPYSYAWKTDGKQWSTETVTLDYDTPGPKNVELRVVDSEGTSGRGSLRIQVGDGIAVNITGPREVQVGQAVSYAPVVVTGPASGFAFSWSVNGQSGSGESFSPLFEEPGSYTLICRAQHPDHPAYQSRAVINVTEAAETESAGPLKVEILGPTETTVRTRVTFEPRVKGGTAPYRYVWTVQGKSVERKTIEGSFKEEGRPIVRLAVYDAAEWSERPLVTTLRVEVTRTDSETTRPTADSRPSPVEGNRTERTTGPISVTSLAGKTYEVYQGETFWGTVRFTGTLKTRTPNMTYYKAVVTRKGKTSEKSFALEQRGGFPFLTMTWPNAIGKAEGDLSRFQVRMGAQNLETSVGRYSRSASTVTFVLR